MVAGESSESGVGFWYFGQFIGMGVIALLIVFQQEVRRFLLLLGSKYNLQNIFNLERLFTKTSIKDEVAAAIVQACDYFSKTKTGALIVLSQNSELYNTHKRVC